MGSRDDDAARTLTKEGRGEPHGPVGSGCDELCRWRSAMQAICSTAGARLASNNEDAFEWRAYKLESTTRRGVDHAVAVPQAEPDCFDRRGSSDPGYPIYGSKFWWPSQ